MNLRNFLRRLLIIALRAARRLLPWGKQHPRLVSVLSYALVEFVAYRRFQSRLAKAREPVLIDARASLEVLKWFRCSAQNKVCPLSYNKETLKQYLRDKGHENPIVTWQHYYAIVAHGLRIFEPSHVEHQELLATASAMARHQGLAPPPPGVAPPTSTEPPAMYGTSQLMVAYKPLPVELGFSIVRGSASALLYLLGYTRHWVSTPEGKIAYWQGASKCSNRASELSAAPCIFIHGVGMGVLPYIIFLEQLRHTYPGPMVAIELPNASRCTFQTKLPDPSSFRHAYQRILLNLGVHSQRGHVLVAHSLGTDYCSMVMNDPRKLNSPILPARLVLVDPICFPHEVFDSHRIMFWTFQEACRKMPAIPRVVIALALYLFIYDEYNQQIGKRALSPGHECMFKPTPEMLRACPTLVCLSGHDATIPSWAIHDWIRAQFPDLFLRMDPQLEHGGFIMSLEAKSWVSKLHLNQIASFISEEKGLPAISSQEFLSDVDVKSEANGMRPSRSAVTFGHSMWGTSREAPKIAQGPRPPRAPLQSQKRRSTFCMDKSQ